MQKGLYEKENNHRSGRQRIVGKRAYSRNGKKKYYKTLNSTFFALVVTAAIAILITTIFMPVLKIYGKSMTPTLNEGDIICTFNNKVFNTGDIIGFYIGNKLLVKRVIAGPGQWVDMDEDGTVYVDGEKLEEPYVTAKAYGNVNIEFPYQVPDERYFVIGDHRDTSQDSRNTAVGCIAEEQIVGKILLRIWPLNQIGIVDN